MKLVLVTGLSGSGKSIALNTLEDLGYYCIDNLPLFLLPGFTEALISRNDPRYKLTAVGVDARNHARDLGTPQSMVEPLITQGIECEILFLEAEDESLIKRYSETRRRHPLSNEQRPLEEAIKLERLILAPFLDAADLIIDTTHTNQHQFRDILKSRINEESLSQVSLLFESFGFKHGVPRDADFVYDVRCLPNPHWQKSLRLLTGRDPAVAAFLERDEKVLRYRDDIIRFLESWIPCFQADARSYLTVAIGCTGGQHRSVYLTEQLSNHFRNSELPVVTRHRDLA